MSLATELHQYICDMEQDVFIEVEEKPNKLCNFIENYNSKYSPSISMDTDGVLILQADADKWGLEYRLYMHEKVGAPVGLRIGRNHTYRVEYAYRINDMGLIRELFDLGYRIGVNCP